MKNPLEQLDYIQFDHSRWLNELIFSSNEIDLYENRLIDLLEQENDEEKI